MSRVVVVLLACLVAYAFAAGGSLKLDGTPATGVLTCDGTGSTVDTWYLDLPVTPENATLLITFNGHLQGGDFCYSAFIGSDPEGDCLGDSTSGTFSASLESVLEEGDDGRGVISVWLSKECEGDAKYQLTTKIMNDSPMHTTEDESLFRSMLSCGTSCCAKRNKLGKCTDRSNCSINCDNPGEAANCFCQDRIPRCFCGSSTF